MKHSKRYEAMIAEEEAKLRWLIARQPASIELQYYLVFLLVANERYVTALRECQRILAGHRDDPVAQTWTETLCRRRMLARFRYTRQQHRKVRGGRLWKHACRRSS